MLIARAILFGCLLGNSLLSCAQAPSPWKNKQCAVVLSYDDALNIHLDQVIPTLDSAGLKGTFYLIGSSAAFTKRIPEWRKAAANGHELGNHTLFHPCYGKRPGREWVPVDYDLNNYTLRRMMDEVRMNNAALEATDGKKKRTMACPCGDTKVQDSSYLYGLKDQFVAFRDGTPDANAVNGFGKVPVEWFSAVNNTGDQLIAAVKKAMTNRSMLVFVFHGVGGDHSINVSAAAHRALIQFLQQNKSQILVAPFVEVAALAQAAR
ncbi:polysaccharide deacetylase family protein [Paraflavitalea pollutisoli]|uniref:polysaccharide deacetylase family protein n=1 Tax=Paraflavitalea pollutisoli TaxID=3034143 RepID=UPI0023ED596D|nr:polysaccharide deacetylase family protein [Paraflavitalea sp. H1-2-19X]